VKPVDSGPRNNARAPVQSNAVYAIVPPTPAQTVTIPRDLHHSIDVIHDGPRQIGTLNADPIAPRRDFGENGSLVFCVVITPDAPAASAVRRIAPTFTGLLIW